MSRRGGGGPLGIPRAGPYAAKHRLHRAGAAIRATVELKVKNVIFAEYVPPDKVVYISRNRMDLSGRRFYSDYDGDETPPLIHDSSDDGSVHRSMAIFESFTRWAVHLSYNVWKLNTISVFASYLFEVRSKFKQVH